MYTLLFLIACSNLNLQMNYKISAKDIKDSFANLSLENKQKLETWSKNDQNITEKYGLSIANKAIFVAIQYVHNDPEEKVFYNSILNNIILSLSNVIKDEQNKMEFWYLWDTPVEKLRTLSYLIKYEFSEPTKHLFDLLGNQIPEIVPELIKIFSEIEDVSLIQFLSKNTFRNHIETIINHIVFKDNYKAIDAFDVKDLLSTSVLQKYFDGGKGLCLQRLWFRLNQPTYIQQKKNFLNFDSKCIVKDEYTMATILKWLEYNECDILHIINPHRLSFEQKKISYYWRSVIDHQSWPLIICLLDCFIWNYSIQYYLKHIKESPILLPIFTLLFTFFLAFIPKYNSQKWHFEQLQVQKNQIFVELNKLCENFKGAKIEVVTFSKDREISREELNVFEGDIKNIHVNQTLLNHQDVQDHVKQKFQELRNTFTQLQNELDDLVLSKYDLISLSNKYHIDCASVNLESLEAQLFEILQQKFKHLVSKLEAIKSEKKGSGTRKVIKVVKIVAQITRMQKTIV